MCKEHENTILVENRRTKQQNNKKNVYILYTHTRGKISDFILIINEGSELFLEH